MKQIISTISKRGEVRIEAEGFVGEECKDATKGYELAMAATSTTHEDRPEMYDGAASTEREKQDLSF